MSYEYARFGGFSDAELRKLRTALYNGKLGGYTVHKGTEKSGTPVDPDPLYIELCTEMNERGMPA